MFTAAPEDLTTSMLSDREAHRRLEWDIRNGHPAQGRRPWACYPISEVVVPLLAAASDGPG
jgi:2-dehydropantoate 2-reductase